MDGQSQTDISGTWLWKADVKWWLFGAGLLTRFYALNWPRQVVFDEFHFGKFVGGYITGRYFFDIHPPLGKLLIAAVAWRAGYDGSQPFAAIGENYKPDVDVFALRVVPATFGAALIPVAYELALELGCSRAASFLVAVLILVDGAVLVESRLLLTDSSLFFWELLQLLTALRASAAAPLSASFHAYLAATGMAIGAAVSTKWTALATMAVVGLDSIRALLLALHAAVLAPTYVPVWVHVNVHVTRRVTRRARAQGWPLCALTP